MIAMSNPSDLVMAHVRDTLARHRFVHVGIVFGSAVRDALRRDSDIDIGVAGSRALNAKQKLKLIDELARSCERPVDLVDLHEASPQLLRQVLTTGRCVLKKEPATYAALLRKMWYGQADLMPNIERILAQRRKRAFGG